MTCCIPSPQTAKCYAAVCLASSQKEEGRGRPAPIFRLSFLCGPVAVMEIANGVRGNVVWVTFGMGKTFGRTASTCLRRGIGNTIASIEENGHPVNTSSEGRETTSLAEIVFVGRLFYGANGHLSDSFFSHSSHALFFFVCACQICSQVSSRPHWSVYASCAFCHSYESGHAYRHCQH